MKDKVKVKEYTSVKKRFDRMKNDRSNWDTMYQVLGEYISQIKQDFQGQPAQGEFLSKDIFDSTGAFAAYNGSSAMLGMLWPGTAEQAIEIVPPEDMPKTTEIQDFYQKMNSRSIKHIDDPKANLTLSLDEYMLDQFIFGTSGVSVDIGTQSKLLYKPRGVKELYIDEGVNGIVDVAGVLLEWDIKRVVAEYGIDNVSEKVAKKYNNDIFDEKVKILLFISPRTEKVATKGKLAMAYQGLHLEYDNCHLLKEEGFHEFPIPTGRMRKLNYEKQGRSPGMNALPDIREANALREAVIIATEKKLDPPLGVLDDGMLGGGYIDTSAASVTVFNASNNIGNSPPVFPIVTVGDLKDAEARLEKLENIISQHFHIDRLIDFNNETQMTFGEAQIRDNIRTASLAGLFIRQYTEVITPVLERSIRILWRGGIYGVLKGSEEEAAAIARKETPEYFPDEIARRLLAGEDIYNIRYKTKAANAARAEEYLAIMDVLRITGEIAQSDTSIGARVDTHKALQRIAEIRGVSFMIRQDDAVQEIQDQQKQVEQQQQTLAAAEQASGVAEKLSKAQALQQQTKPQGSPV